jgi:DNA repair exonuclease SbcCD nuclease subunit
MKLVFFSDLHAHPFKPYATILANGMNSRLADAVGCVEQIYEYCTSHPVDAVLFGGDMFHVRRTIVVQAFNAVYEAMSKFKLSNIPALLIGGNHDQADRDGSEHSVHAFRTFATVVDEPGWVTWPTKSGEIQLLAVPYCEDVEVIRSLADMVTKGNRPRLFLGHFGVQGAKVGADFVYENPYDVTVADLNQPSFDAGFLGHYHLYQPVGMNFHYIGAPLHHSWGDVGQPRGFIVYDTETKTHEYINLRAPRFVDPDLGVLKETLKQQSTIFEDCYVRTYDGRSWSDDEREDMCKKLKARSFEVFPPKVKSANGQKPGARLEFKPGASYPDMVERYVRSGVQSAEGLDPEYLAQLGAEVLEEVESES